MILSAYLIHELFGFWISMWIETLLETSLFFYFFSPGAQRLQRKEEGRVVILKDIFLYVFSRPDSRGSESVSGGDIWLFIIAVFRSFDD